MERSLIRLGRGILAALVIKFIQHVAVVGDLLIDEIIFCRLSCSQLVVRVILQRSVGLERGDLQRGLVDRADIGCQPALPGLALAERDLLADVLSVRNLLRVTACQIRIAGENRQPRGIGKDILCVTGVRNAVKRRVMQVETHRRGGVAVCQVDALGRVVVAVNRKAVRRDGRSGEPVAGNLLVFLAHGIAVKRDFKRPGVNRIAVVVLHDAICVLQRALVSIVAALNRNDEALLAAGHGRHALGQAHERLGNGHLGRRRLRVKRIGVNGVLRQQGAGVKLRVPCAEALVVVIRLHAGGDDVAQCSLAAVAQGEGVLLRRCTPAVPCAAIDLEGNGDLLVVLVGQRQRRVGGVKLERLRYSRRQLVSVDVCVLLLDGIGPERDIFLRPGVNAVLLDRVGKRQLIGQLRAVFRRQQDRKALRQRIALLQAGHRLGDGQRALGGFLLGVGVGHAERQRRGGRRGGQDDLLLVLRVHNDAAQRHGAIVAIYRVARFLHLIAAERDMLNFCGIFAVCRQYRPIQDVLAVLQQNRNTLRQVAVGQAGEALADRQGRQLDGRIAEVLDFLLLTALTVGVGQRNAGVGVETAVLPLGIRIRRDGEAGRLGRAGDLAHVPGEGAVLLVPRQRAALGERRQRDVRKVDQIHDRCILTGCHRTDRLAPLGQDVVEVREKVAALEIDIAIIRCQALQISAGRIRQVDADGIQRNARILQGLGLHGAVPLGIVLPVARSAGRAVGNKHHIGRARLVAAAVEDVLRLGQRRCVVGTAAGPEPVDRVVCRCGCVGQVAPRVNGMIARSAASAAEADDRNAVLRAARQQGVHKVLSCNLGRVHPVEVPGAAGRLGVRIAEIFPANTALPVIGFPIPVVVPIDVARLTRAVEAAFAHAAGAVDHEHNVDRGLHLLRVRHAGNGDVDNVIAVPIQGIAAVRIHTQRLRRCDGAFFRASGFPVHRQRHRAQ